jgi:hypothetical protein
VLYTCGTDFVLAGEAPPGQSTPVIGEFEGSAPIDTTGGFARGSRFDRACADGLRAFLMLQRGVYGSACRWSSPIIPGQLVDQVRAEGTYWLEATGR